jgi:hypothetical protein
MCFVAENVQRKLLCGPSLTSFRVLHLFSAWRLCNIYASFYTKNTQANLILEPTILYPYIKLKRNITLHKDGLP